MEFPTRAPGACASIALFPGAWNPPTRAHVAMAEAALEHAGALVFVLARTMPHKTLEGASMERRIAWLEAISASNSRFFAGISDGGLFIEMARECREATGASRIFVVCGRDAAHRIVAWDYGPSDSIERQFEEYSLLVAPRGEPYDPPPHLASRILQLHLPGDWRDVSSTEVRRRIASRENVAGLVPDAILESVLGA